MDAGDLEAAAFLGAAFFGAAFLAGAFFEAALVAGAVTRVGFFGALVVVVRADVSVAAFSA